MGKTVIKYLSLSVSSIVLSIVVQEKSLAQDVDQNIISACKQLQIQCVNTVMPYIEQQVPANPPYPHDREVVKKLVIPICGTDPYLPPSSYTYDSYPNLPTNTYCKSYSDQGKTIYTPNAGLLQECTGSESNPGLCQGTGFFKSEKK